MTCEAQLWRHFCQGIGQYTPKQAPINFERKTFYRGSSIPLYYKSYVLNWICPLIWHNKPMEKYAENLNLKIAFIYNERWKHDV